MSDWLDDLLDDSWQLVVETPAGPGKPLVAEQRVISPPIAEGQVALFGDDDQFRLTHQLWGGMPEFSQTDQLPDLEIVVHFANEQDLAAFAELVGQKLYAGQTRSIWYPKPETRVFMDKRWVSRATG